MIKIFNFEKNRLNGLDHLRALAIILVMIFHYEYGVPIWLSPILKIGWTGVDLFFVLSGYLIGFQLLKEIKNTGNISFKRFYIKRFFRIIPAYVVVLIFYYSLQNYREGSGMPPLWKFLTFTQNIWFDALHAKSFSHAWSLCIEEQFYLLLPLSILTIFLFKLQSKAVYLFFGLIIIGFVCRLFNWYIYVQPFIDNNNEQKVWVGFLEKIYYPSYNRMDGLVIGVSIAAIFNFKPKLTKFLTANGNILLLTGIGLIVLTYKLCNVLISFNTGIYVFPLASIAYGFMVIAALSPTCILNKFKSKITFIIATLSYVIYLTHKQVFHLIRMGITNFGFDSNSTWVFWVCLIIALLIGLIMHIVVEKPFFRLRDKILSKNLYGIHRKIIIRTIFKLKEYKTSH